ncbi:hypothetical protein DAPPUDRAFT_324152 [Daphnia pulex]|uniref:Uncharacterized protein n=1 Tax=Daphnia pulex TaxID=6669 RepID=E9H0V4_DAPPU|nr:hypothetical protein DAPPUDRAFT_324152 [Daphnia pulex]|eukprot:EFX74636.1 hypothetical protein DAPPUDRAFT_324152 [Daphnia pulex]
MALNDEFRSLDLSPNKSLNMRSYGRKVYKRAVVHVPTYYALLIKTGPQSGQLPGLSIQLVSCPCPCIMLASLLGCPGPTPLG